MVTLFSLDDSCSYKPMGGIQMKRLHMFFATAMAISFFVFSPTAFAENDNDNNQQPDYLSLVKGYADAMIEDGRDVYGEVHSPLFAAALDRKTMTIGEFEKIPGVRSIDRCLTAANPMQDQNLYQIMYALSEITGEKRYAEEADKTLKYFFETCQSPGTGLMAWGEHAWWDLKADAMRGGMHDGPHEFLRPWVLWDRCYELTPDAVLKCARGLWDHQIYDHETGEFSRHASWSKHGPEGEWEFPRHGGFYIVAWAKAYRETKDPVYPKAVNTLIDMFNRNSSKLSGAMRSCTNWEIRHLAWPPSSLGLAIDLTDSAPSFPEPLAQKMMERARKSDRIYLKCPHDLSPDGRGFVNIVDVHTLKLREDWRDDPYTKHWVTGYGAAVDAMMANLCYRRYVQLEDGETKDGFRKLVIGSARRYLSSNPDLSKPIYPGSMGEVIIHMLNAYEISGDKKFLDRADHFARIAVDNFLADDSPLPRASSVHDHYEAITWADDMMMSLLKLWVATNKPDVNVSLVWCNR